MFENTVVLTKEEYESLVRKAERISVLERVLNSNKYLCKEDIAQVLDIELIGADDE